MRKVIIIVCILLSVVGIGCLPSKPAVAVATPTDVAQDAAIARVTAAITSLDASKASQASINDVNDRISKINASVTPDTYPKAQLYTKTEVEAAIAAAINALKTNTDQSWIKGGVGTGTVGSGNPNIALINTGDYSYRVYQKPSSPVYIAQSYSWAIEITNNTARWKKVQIGGTLNPDTSVAGTGVLAPWSGVATPATGYTAPTGTYFNCLNYSLGTTNPTGVMPTYVTPGSPTPSVMFGTPGGNGGVFTFGAGEKKLIWISLNLAYTSGVTQWLDPNWNISLSD